MPKDAYELLDVSPDADGRTIEAAYWRRAKELKQLRQFKPEAAEELDRVNEAYELLIDERRTSPQVNQPAKRGLRRRIAIVLVASVVTVVGVSAGLTYREDIRSTSITGYDRAQEGWEDTIDWLQALDEEPTPQPPNSTSR